jgi:hypothetical protein
MLFLGWIGLCSALMFGVSSALVDADSAQNVHAPPIGDAAAIDRGSSSAPRVQSSGAITTLVYLPSIGKGWLACPLPGGPYGTVAVFSTPSSPPAQINADINLMLRGYTPTVAFKGLVDLGGGPPSDPNAPQLFNLFADERVPSFNSVYQVYDWDWTCNCRGQPLSDWPVTLVGLGVSAGEPICAPGSGYDIGRAPVGYSMMVLYASSTQLTVKYTREDNVVNGYTVHIENINVAPDLLALYQSMDAAGRGRLPALFGGQAVGRAITTELGVAIRDTGSFLDPRSRQDWWQGK